MICHFSTNVSPPKQPRQSLPTPVICFCYLNLGMLLWQIEDAIKLGRGRSAASMIVCAVYCAAILFFELRNDLRIARKEWGNDS